MSLLGFLGWWQERTECPLPSPTNEPTHFGQDFKHSCPVSPSAADSVLFAVGGYAKLLVQDIDEATAIARRHPALAYGMIIEVRAMTPDCHLGVVTRPTHPGGSAHLAPPVVRRGRRITLAPAPA